MKNTFRPAYKVAIMKILSVTALSFGLSVSVYAQTMQSEDSIYQGLGQKEGITKIVNDFVPMIMSDPRIAQFFTKVPKEHFSALLVDQFCELAGGPCKYTGRNMFDAHQGMNITNAQFNALAEDLQIAMEKNDVPTSVSNKLVAMLAPMQRPIVSK